jgi:hypothetical protein
MRPIVTAKTYRVITYIDGFNLFYGLRDSGFKRYYWLDLWSLSANLLRPDQKLEKVKYFTARISSPQSKRLRQLTYLEALGTLPNVEIFEGHYLDKPVTCRSCGASWSTHEEKMTDVNIATELLTDAFRDRYDTALIISADSDLVPPVRAVNTLFPTKRLVAAFPPGRTSRHLASAVYWQFTIGRAKLAASQFPNSITKPDGHILNRPASWR